MNVKIIILSKIKPLPLWHIRKNGSNKYFSLKISDNGYGISAFDIKYIFDKFYRSNPKEYIQGMGLGLSYIKIIAEAHGGSIEVESELGEGSRFTLKIPK